MRRWIVMRRRVTPIPRLAAALFTRLIGTVKVHGQDLIPPEGSACILAFNHPNRYDGVLLFGLLPRRDVATLDNGTIRQRPVRRLLVEIAGGIWVEPGESEDTMQEILRLLRDGWALALAPEGRTTANDGLALAQRGLGFIALKAGVPVVPIAISGSEDARLGLPGLTGRIVTIRVGRQLCLPSAEGRSGRETQRLASDAIMCRIAEMLPPRLRGEYEDAVCRSPLAWLEKAGSKTPRD
jgi:1-acyl-sn-glycerol-3-phosphate acyltransferase